MKVKALLFVFVCLFVMPIVGSATGSYKTVYYDGKAAIKVDGDLSDWDKMSLPSSQLIFDDSNSPVNPENANDFSAIFQCFSDINYIYVSVIVNDDKVIYGNERLGKLFHDDSVWIHFPNGRKENSRSSLAVSLNYDGTTRMEYYEDPVDQRYPFIYEFLGVQAVFKKNEKGYIVEIAIPQ